MQTNLKLTNFIGQVSYRFPEPTRQVFFCSLIGRTGASPFADDGNGRNRKTVGPIRSAWLLNRKSLKSCSAGNLLSCLRRDGSGNLHVKSFPQIDGLDFKVSLSKLYFLI
jgi:hypothetical protein